MGRAGVRNLIYSVGIGFLICWSIMTWQTVIGGTLLFLKRQGYVTGKNRTKFSHLFTHVNNKNISYYIINGTLLLLKKIS